MRTRPTLLTAAAVTLGAALALGMPLSASAHVTLDENTAEAGSYALLTFKVPNESDTAATTAITITLPADTPFVSARYVPVPGWEGSITTGALPEPVEIGDTTVTEAPLSITFTATGEGLVGAELGIFQVSLGPVPDVGSVELPVVQTYSDGSESRWEGEEAPVLYVNDPPAADHHGGAHDEEAEAGEGDEESTTETPDTTAVTGVVLGAIGLVLGAAALALALIRRRPEA